MPFIKLKIVDLTCLMLVGVIVLMQIARIAFAADFQAETLFPQITQSGRYFNFPVGIARNQKGFFYITDSQSHRVKVLTAQGELLRTWGGLGVGQGQFDKPLGIALTPSGDVLVADTNNNRIQKFNSEGKYLAQLGGFGTATGQFNHPNHLAVDKTGRIYVSDTRNHRVQIFSASGQWVRSFGGFGNGDGQLNNPLGIAVNADGEIFVAEGADNHRISVFDSQGVFLRSWGRQGALNGQFDNLENIALDDQSRVFVSEYGNNRIQVFGPSGQWLRSWGQFGYTGAALRTPFGLVIDPDSDSLFVADTSNNRIQQYDLQGKYIGAWQSQGNGAGEFAAPKLSLSPQGEIYVADQLNHRIQVFSATGEWLRSFGEFGSKPGQFNAPNHVIFDDQDRVLVADTGNNRIQIFDQQGRYLNHWGVSGTGAGQLNGPGNFTIGPDGLLYITELVNHRVSVFTLDGQYVRSWGKFGSGKRELNKPDGIVIDDEDLVFVADHDNHRIQVFNTIGDYVREWGTDGSAPGQFNHPHGLALSPAGLLYNADALNNRIQVFQRDGTLVEIIGEAGTQPGQFGQPYTVALADENTLYVSEVANNRIQILKRRTISPHSAFKAILLAGGGASTSTFENPIWDATELLTNNAYYALRAQDLKKDDILYLTSGNTQNDLDEDGQYNDVQTANLASLQQGITEWASNADNVIIYLNDHGGDGKFKVNQNEILTSKQFKQWLDVLNEKISGKITVIIEACQSGSFIPDLAQSRHVLIASAKRDQPAVVSNQGMTSFSYHFWYAVHTGNTLQKAFKKARQGISRENVLVNNIPQEQDAQLDANGDGQFDAQDYTDLGDYCLAKCKKTAADEPQVTPLTASADLAAQTHYTLRMRVTSLAPLSQAWALISRPDVNYDDPSQPISELPSVNMRCEDQDNGQYLCEGDYSQFTVNGDYHITFHARDQKNRSSIPNDTIILTQDINPNTTTGDTEDNIVYDTQSGRLSIRDIVVLGEHYQVTLQHRADQLTLTGAIKINQPVKPPTFPAQFDTINGILTLPKVLVQDHYYQATLSNMGNYVFKIEMLKDLGPAILQPDNPNTGVDDAPPDIS